MKSSIPLSLFCLILFPFFLLAQNPSSMNPNSNSGTVLAQANNQFAFEFYQVMQKANPQKNLIFSPFSFEIAFGMLQAGAVGEAKNELNKYFHYPNGENLGADIQRLQQGISKLQTDSCQIKLANSIWIENTLRIKPAYKNYLQKYFDSQLFQEDFSNPQTLGKVNNWVSQATNEKIPQILDKLGRESALILINTIYFNAAWLKPFDGKKTHDEYFHLENGEREIVKLMQEKGDFRYFENAEMQLVELPYFDNKFSMLVLLPKNQQLSEYEKTLNSTKLANLQDNLSKQSLDVVKIPRFKMNLSLPAKDYLSNLGIKKIFSGGLQGISDDALQVSDVKHKVYIEVGEKGTEAAAVTAVVAERSVIKPETFTKTFIADRPFLFFIQEKQSQTILFMGKVMNPNEGE
jgi:serpin B